MGIRCSINTSHIKKDLFSISITGSICTSHTIIISENIKLLDHIPYINGKYALTEQYLSDSL
ncbi:hypothetical protein Metev_0361 [Methanohalobium evestigatum Z-7303]|uniref:Uncharacterized protein n=1 Tax=Methanohalobium evestigatum (strain ATCC BAA-1072 / DSM 3721 / NBRC 107634 / OCM 161 / Z-7303) TaxID=644295 RepID=D7E6R3_METEZ|nr:hypothetical protein Metev_0361 [Methanohalobium evestigatum Z-7303]